MSSVVAAEESDDRWDRSVHRDLDEEEDDDDDDDDQADKGVALYVVVESRDPYRDFRASMQEMVEADQTIEDLLLGDLSVNDRTNHSYILRAFVDLLLRHMDKKIGPSPHMERRLFPVVNGLFSTTSSSPCSPKSFYMTSL